jgi:hypothetical protein
MPFRWHHFVRRSDDFQHIDQPTAIYVICTGTYLMPKEESKTVGERRPKLSS